MHFKIIIVKNVLIDLDSKKLCYNSPCLFLLMQVVEVDGGSGSASLTGNEVSFVHVPFIC